MVKPLSMRCVVRLVIFVRGQMVNHKQLYDFTKHLMMKLRVSHNDAHLVADNLITSNLRGIDSHGVGLLKLYVSGIQSGFIIPNVRPEIIKESPILAKVDGKNGLGQVSGCF